MATQMTAPGAPPDMKKAYKEEWEALEVTLLQLDVMKQNITQRSAYFITVRYYETKTRSQRSEFVELPALLSLNL